MYVLSRFYMAVSVQLRFHLSASADKYAKDPLAMQPYLMYANCVERGHQLELVVCTCLALIHEVGKPANCVYQRHPSWVLSTRLIYIDTTCDRHLGDLSFSGCDHTHARSVHMQRYPDGNG